MHTDVVSREIWWVQFCCKTGIISICLQIFSLLKCLHLVLSHQCLLSFVYPWCLSNTDAESVGALSLSFNTGVFYGISTIWDCNILMPRLLCWCWHCVCPSIVRFQLCAFSFLCCFLVLVMILKWTNYTVLSCLCLVLNYIHLDTDYSIDRAGDH